jgi:hypothetical protein
MLAKDEDVGLWVDKRARLRLRTLARTTYVVATVQYPLKKLTLTTRPSTLPTVPCGSVSDKVPAQ